MSGPLWDVRVSGRLIEKATAFRNFDPVLKRHLNKNLRAATAPLKQAIKQSALDTLPKAGGLAELVAESRTTTVSVVRSKGAIASVTGVRLTTRNAHSIKTMDGGKVRHPDWPRGTDRSKWKWSEQDVKPGWWSDPVEKYKPEIESAVLKAVEASIQEIRKA